MIKNQRQQQEQQPDIEEEKHHVDDGRWNEGLANHEKLKKLLPFMNEEDEGYL